MIKLKISDLAIMQLIDLQSSQSRVAESMSGINKMFVAPEIRDEGRLTIKADTWSLGAILYLLVVGEFRTSRKHPSLRHIKSEEVSKNTIAKANSITVCPLEKTPSTSFSTPIFDFSEPNWSKFSSEISEFIYQCLDEDACRRPSATELLENSSLMQYYRLDNLDKHHYKEMVESDYEINSFKIHFEHLFNKIIH